MAMNGEEENSRQLAHRRKTSHNTVSLHKNGQTTQLQLQSHRHVLSSHSALPSPHDRHIIYCEDKPRSSRFLIADITPVWSVHISPVTYIPQ